MCEKKTAPDTKLLSCGELTSAQVWYIEKKKLILCGSVFLSFFFPLENIPSLHPVTNGWRLQVGDQAHTPTSKLCLEEAICYPGGIYHNIPPPCKLFIWRSSGTKSICWVIGRTRTVHLFSAVPLCQRIMRVCVCVCACVAVCVCVLLPVTYLVPKLSFYY